MNLLNSNLTILTQIANQSSLLFTRKILKTVRAQALVLSYLSQLFLNFTIFIHLITF